LTVGALVLATVFLLTLALGVALARGILSLMLRVCVTGQPPAASSLRIAAFVGALVALWSLAPAIVEGPAASADQGSDPLTRVDSRGLTPP
jgi:hypothetical protein